MTANYSVRTKIVGCPINNKTEEVLYFYFKEKPIKSVVSFYTLVLHAMHLSEELVWIGSRFQICVMVTHVFPHFSYSLIDDSFFVCHFSYSTPKRGSEDITRCLYFLSKKNSYFPIKRESQGFTVYILIHLSQNHFNNNFFSFTILIFFKDIFIILIKS